jgi:hypothetical protein
MRLLSQPPPLIIEALRASGTPPLPACYRRLVAKHPLVERLARTTPPTNAPPPLAKASLAKHPLVAPTGASGTKGRRWSRSAPRVACYRWMPQGCQASIVLSRSEVLSVAAEVQKCSYAQKCS